jgi:serine/threonine protein phosphatase PrpC
VTIHDRIARAIRKDPVSLQLPAASSRPVSHVLHRVCAARTHPGRRYEKNEDAYLASPYFGLFGVADGIGGAPAGAVASAIAAATVNEVVSAAGAVGSPAAALLTRAVQEANSRILAAAQQDTTMEGMGTTMTVALARGPRVVLAHVGDSRAYLLHGHRLDRVTEDHVLQNDGSWAAMDPEQRKACERYRLALTRALGTRETVDVDVRALLPQDGDLLLLCSDGLTNALTEREIGAILLEHHDVGAAADRLVARTNEEGGPDNVTVVLVRWVARGGAHEHA